MRWCLLSAAVLAAFGCSSREDDTIRTYTVPKPAEVEAAAVKEEFQILAGIFPADNPGWFLKLAGRTSDIAPHEANFKKLLESVRFPNGGRNAPAYTLPDGWTHGGARPDKLADETVQLPGGKLEITVTRAGGELGENILRWVKQLGKNSDADAAKALAKPILGGSGAGWFVDVRGPKNPVGRPGGMMMGK
jgi:hypothetical protein